MQNFKYSEKKAKLEALLKNKIINEKEYNEKLNLIKKEFNILDEKNEELSKKEILDLLLKNNFISRNDYINELIGEDKVISPFIQKKYKEYKNNNLNKINGIGNDNFEKLKINSIPKNIELGKAFIKIEKLTKKYSRNKKAAISDVSFNIYPNQFHVFIGPNGAGKTTTIKSIIGAYSSLKFSGKIFINNIDNKNAMSRKDIGYVPEEAKFPKNMKAYEYLILMSSVSGISKDKAKIIIEKLSEKLNFKDLLYSKPYRMSSGQKKKILLAQALINDPKILIMDEPAANLDPLAREQLFALLVEFQSEGKSIFISSHILDEISKYATYVTIINNGNIKYNGPISNHESLLKLYKENINNLF